MDCSEWFDMAQAKMIGREVWGVMTKINPRVDFAFKRLFGSEENKDILIHFLNAILFDGKETIKEVELDKELILDAPFSISIKAINDLEKELMIKLQISGYFYYEKRKELLSSEEAYAKQMKRAGFYEKFNKTIIIYILSLEAMKEKEGYHNIYKIHNEKNQKKAFEDLEIHTIELTKFEEKLMPFKTVLDLWTFFLRKADQYSREAIPQEFKKEPILNKAFRALDEMYFSDEDEKIYNARLKFLRDEWSKMQYAHLEGKAEGLAEGKAEGLAEGEAKGLEKGKLEERKAIVSAMIKQGMSHAVIASILEISEADVKTLMALN